MGQVILLASSSSLNTEKYPTRAVRALSPASEREDANHRAPHRAVSEMLWAGMIVSQSHLKT